MDVVVCGAQKPFVRGGAELLQENLVQAIAAEGHRAELVRLPVAWEKDRLFDAPLAWRLVPVDADLVIATNFPSYFVRHPRKVVWLLHQHRGAYDAADAAWSDFGPEDGAVEVQRLLSEWDNRALEEAERLYTISGVVADRLRDFSGLAAKPLYHPPPLADRLHPGPFGDYVFCATRLEANKRSHLLVDSLPHIRPEVRSVVAGRGEFLDDLAARVRRQDLGDRVELRGFVPDEELVELFAGALAVVYAPSDEDYGYVTIEAFAAARPVVTLTDSGGPLEFVTDGQTGLVAPPESRAIAEAFDRLHADRALATRLGAAGREKLRATVPAWPEVGARLLD